MNTDQHCYPWQFFAAETFMMKPYLITFHSNVHILDLVEMNKFLGGSLPLKVSSTDTLCLLLRGLLQFIYVILGSCNKVA